MSELVKIACLEDEGLLGQNKGLGDAPSKSMAEEKRLIIDFDDSLPAFSSKLLSYGPESSLLLGLAGPLALSLMLHFISDADLKIVRQQSNLELDQQIALGI